MNTQCLKRAEQLLSWMKPEVFIYPILPTAWALTLHRSGYLLSPLIWRTSGWLEPCASTLHKSRRHLHNRSWRAVVLCLLRGISAPFKMTKIRAEGRCEQLLQCCCFTGECEVHPKWASPDEESRVGWTKATAAQTASVKRLLTAELVWLLTTVHSPLQTFCNTGNKRKLRNTVYFLGSF